MSLRLQALRANNYRILKLVDIEFDNNDNIVKVTGKNKQGKSTVIDSIWVALGGSREIPNKPVRDGEEEAEIELELDEFIVTRKIKPNGDNKLIVTDKEGNRVNKPQTLLNSLMTKIGLRPRKFADADKEDQVEMLMEVIDFEFDDEELLNKADDKIDIEGHNPIEKIENAEDSLVKERRDINRDLRKVKNKYESYEDIEPTDEVNVSELVDERDELQAENESILEDKELVEEYTDEVEKLNEEANDIRDEIERLKVKLAGIEDEIEDVEEKRDDVKDRFDEEKDKLEENKDRIEEINNEIKQANEINKKAQQYKEKMEYKEELDELQEISDEYTEEIESVRDYKDEVMEKSEFPIDGLSFEDGEVYYNGIPFDQASATEKLEVGFAVMKANKPDLRVVLVDNGRTIDEENMEFLRKLAEEDDYLVLMEYMDTDEETGIVIENGEVKKNNYKQATMFDDEFFDQGL